MKLLFVATKLPWPATDGGRVVVWHTLAGLAGCGVEVTLVAPARSAEEVDHAHAAIATLARLVPVIAPAARRARGLATAFRERAPLSIVRHRSRAVSAAVADLVSREPFDVVHAEQLQSVANCLPARAAGVPVVLRAQNVESDLWAQLATFRPVLGPLLRREARRLREWEASAVRECARTIALTREDRERLADLAGDPTRIVSVPAPFPALAPAPAVPRLAGDPALVLFGSNDWLPNRDGVGWFLSAVWPAIRRACPGALLHVFGFARRGRARDGVVAHAAPSASAAAFTPGAVLLVPLRIASGVRVKILEAWSRGAPVVATPQAGAGLDASDGKELFVAARADDFVAAITRLRDPECRRRVVDAARSRLVDSHSPKAVATRLIEVYGEAAL